MKLVPWRLVLRGVKGALIGVAVAVLEAVAVGTIGNSIVKLKPKSPAFAGLLGWGGDGIRQLAENLRYP
jgi:hypothetical protein